MADQAKNWEDVKSYSLDEAAEQALYDAQIECTLIWSSKDGWPMGVIVNYIQRDGRFWLVGVCGAGAAVTRNLGVLLVFVGVVLVKFH